jgi:hypothetical protein
MKGQIMFNLHDLDELMDDQYGKPYQDTPAPTQYALQDFMRYKAGVDLEPIDFVMQAMKPEVSPDYQDPMSQPLDSIQQMDFHSGKGGELPASFNVSVRPDYTDEQLEDATGLKWSGKHGKDGQPTFMGR